MIKPLAFIIKDISVSKDINTLLCSRKFAFSDYITTGIKNYFLSINFFFNWLHQKLKETVWNQVSFVSFPGPIDLTGECFRFTQGHKWRRNDQLSLRLSFMGTLKVKLSSAMSRNICNCIYHSNVNLILETLHSNILDIFPLHSDQLVKDSVWEIKNTLYVI